MPFIGITEEQEQSLLEGVISGGYALLLGAGASHDSSNHFGELPLGKDLAAELAQVTGAPEGATLQRVFGLLSPEQIKDHVTDRLSGARPGLTARAISSYNWRQIFTFNIDDSLEAAYTERRRQDLRPFHFSDPFETFQTIADLPLIYLHGTVKRPEKGYVFTRDQYIRIIKGQNPWMMMLSSVLRSGSVIISGASLDEVDLEYYLSFRDVVSAREDAPPSIFVSGDESVLTKALCRDHGLVHFKGHSVDFFNYLRAKIPSPPQIDERISGGVGRILPSGIDRTAAMQFDADFELIPVLTLGGTVSNKFYYGSPPSWVDLASQLDIPRAEVAPTLANMTSAQGGRQIFILFGPTGSGKTTILRRSGYNLASKAQYHVLWASELGQMARTTASTLDAIDGPVALIVDNFADHVQSIADVLARAERDDLLILGGERGYRKQYIDRTLGSKGYHEINLQRLRDVDVDRLVQKMSDRMLVGSHLAISRDTAFLNSLRGDPIAVVACRILNDFRPLSRIVEGLVRQSSAEQLQAFVSVAICSYCFKGGVRLSILSTVASADALRHLLNDDTGVSLAFVDSARSFVTVGNSTIADEVLFYLSRVRADVVLDGFAKIANAIAPYVNRNAIRARSPEARLSGRLFDYDDVVEKFLKDRASEFYEQTKEAWRWNSRYWEQTALLRLSQSQRVRGYERQDLLEEALQNARYSLAVEEHPFGLTTLGKVLMHLYAEGGGDRAYFEEAFESLKSAIGLEDRLGRASMHPYVTLLSGCAIFLERGGKFNSRESYDLRRICEQAKRRWPSEVDLGDVMARVTKDI